MMANLLAVVKKIGFFPLKCKITKKKKYRNRDGTNESNATHSFATRFHYNFIFMKLHRFFFRFCFIYMLVQLGAAMFPIFHLKCGWLFGSLSSHSAVCFMLVKADYGFGVKEKHIEIRILILCLFTVCFSLEP